MWRRRIRRRSRRRGGATGATSAGTPHIRGSVSKAPPRGVDAEPDKDDVGAAPAENETRHTLAVALVPEASTEHGAKPPRGGLTAPRGSALEAAARALRSLVVGPTRGATSRDARDDEERRDDDGIA